MQGKLLLAALFGLMLFGFSPALAVPRPSITHLSPNAGLSGIKVQIHGSHFGTRQGQVVFGTTAATISRWRKTLIVAISPFGVSGRTPVRVTTRGGTSNRKFYTFQTQTVSGNFKVFANNDLGMHCVDQDFSVFSILPPFNVVNAQVVGQNQSGQPYLLGNDQTVVRYTAVMDKSGSDNSFSVGKTNFWDYVQHLFGANLTPGVGLTGLCMPGDASNLNTQTAFTYSNSESLFKAFGIPITPVDDAGNKNRYPLMRINAYQKGTNALLASTDVVLPVSEETTCRACHATGSLAAHSQAISWSQKTDIEVQSRENILLLHDANTGTTLMDNRPVLCAQCHYSKALDLAGSGPGGSQTGHNSMSGVMHSFHADKMLDSNRVPLSDQPVLANQNVPLPNQQACYMCHPGQTTKCLRGAMSTTISCQNCHGNMSAVGGDHNLLAGGSIDGTNDGHARRPWQDLPRCQSCHTGDAVSHVTLASNYMAPDGLRTLLAFDPNDSAASPRKAGTSRFVENTNKLFRFSKGHGNLSCEACHGSTHAIWPNNTVNANDNVAAVALQGHSGTIMECSACHKSGTLNNSLDGPHGMHNNDQRWVGSHPGFYRNNQTACQACHGTTLRGSPLAVAAADRSFSVEDRGTVNIAKGQQVTCYTCHNGPGGD